MQSQDTTAADPFVPALVAVLLHKLANTTQYLGALNTLLAIDADASSNVASLKGLGGTAVEVDEFGWTLGLLANACGADLLLDRRERDGLGSFLRVVGEVVRREGRSLAAARATVAPLLASSGDEDWRVPWSIGRWLHGAARALPAGATLTYDFDLAPARPRVVVEVAAAAEVGALARSLALFDPRLEFDLDATRPALILPARALRVRAESTVP